MKITNKILPINPFSRPGYKLNDVLGIVFHWVGKASQTNDQTARYFELLSKQSLEDAQSDRYASAHFIIGMDGEVIQCIPTEELAYHVGARKYTQLAKDHFGVFATNGKMIGYDDEYYTPNWITIGIELNHPDGTGEFTEATLRSAEYLGWELLRDHHLNRSDIYRHYDISFDSRTGSPKICPKWFVDHGDEWRKFTKRIDSITSLEE